MTARAQFEQACHAAIAKLRDNISEGVYRPTADNQCVDAILRAWDKSVIRAVKGHQAAELQRHEQVLKPLVDVIRQAAR